MSQNDGGRVPFSTRNPILREVVADRKRIDALETLDQAAWFIRQSDVGATPYTVTADDHFLNVDSTIGVVTVDLPAVSGNAGRVLVIKDSGGAAGGSNITVDGNGAETIDGAGTATIAANYGVLRLYSDGTEWFSW